MPTTPPPIDPVPLPAPQRGDRTTFSQRVDAFVMWLINAVTQFAAVALNVYNNTVEAFTYSQVAASQAAAASALVNVSKWVSGTTYANGATVWSPANGQTYRRTTASGSGTTDPSLDATNWAPVVGVMLNTVGRNANYTATRADKGTHQSFAGGTFTLTMPDAATVGNGWYIYASTYGDTGALTVAAAGANLIEGTVSYVVPPKHWVMLASNGTNFEIVAAGAKRAGRFGNAMTAAATLNLDAVAGSAVFINGNTTITTLTLAPGVTKTLVFTGTPRMVHGASLFMPEDQDMFLANGATVTVMGEPSGAVRVIGYGKANKGFWQIQDQKASGAASGVAATQAETARALNTTVGANTIAGSSMGTNQFTLPAGTYDVSAVASVYQVNGHRLRLYNVTDAAYPLSGPNGFASSTAGGGGYGTVQGRITITGAKTFELRHYTQANNGGATNGFGTATSQTGVLEVYADITIEKVA